MRRPRMAGGLLVAVCAGSFGCLWQDPDRRTTALLQSFPAPQASTDGGLVLTSRLLDGPAGDPFLATDVWAAAGSPVPHETAALLARNGLRVGVLSGMVPPEFDRRVRSERQALDPRLQTTRPGQAKIVPVQGPLDRCTYHVLADLTADPVPVEFEAAECGLAVTPTPADGNRVRLACEFRVQHGDRQAWLRPTADGSGFVRQDRKALESYSSLGFTVTLGPAEFLVIGATADPVGTLGQSFFLTGGPDEFRRRVLVVQAGRVEPAPAGPATTPARAVLQD